MNNFKIVAIYKTKQRSSSQKK